MKHLRILTASEQVAGYMRGEIMAGRLRGEMPGVLKLEVELGVNRNTLEAALRLLEKEGFLVPQGAGKPRRIVPAKAGPGERPALRIALLLYEANDRRVDYLVRLEKMLAAAGHAMVTAPWAITELGMDLGRITRMVEGIEANAWIVMSGSGELLKWFAAGNLPIFALFGRRGGLPLAGTGPDKPPAYAVAVRHLHDLGHRRIVLLTRRERRLPLPGASERAFLDALRAVGIEPSTFNLPDWRETPDGFMDRLASLYQLTPPTALIVDEAPFFFATLQFLACRGLRVPEDVSLICTDADPHFDWSRPSIAHIRWDSTPVIRRILRWANHLSHGKDDRQQTLTPAEFVPGGTVGEVPRR